MFSSFSPWLVKISYRFLPNGFPDHKSCFNAVRNSIDLENFVLVDDLYSTPNIVRVIKSRRMRRAGHVARMGGERGVYRVLVGKPEGKRPLGRPRRRWVDNIRMDLQ